MISKTNELSRDTLYHREEVSFTSGRDNCGAWLYKPGGSQVEACPVIVMAPGFGGTRDCGLEPYAEKFANAGYLVLLFDYRYFGASGGKPRQRFSIARQLEDWASAISYVRDREDVDGDRIALWGTSFAGGHVIVAAARDGRIAAISSQCPLVDARTAALASLRHSGIFSFLKQGMFALADQIGSLFGARPIYMPLVAKPGNVAAMNSPDTVAGYGALTPPDWQNRVTMRHILTITNYRPIKHARKMKCPALIQVCMNDKLVPPGAAVRMAKLSGVNAQLERYDCEHFDIYLGGHFTRASNEQLAFFNRTLKGK